MLTDYWNDGVMTKPYDQVRRHWIYASKNAYLRGCPESPDGPPEHGPPNAFE